MHIPRLADFRACLKRLALGAPSITVGGTTAIKEQLVLDGIEANRFERGECACYESSALQQCCTPLPSLVQCMRFVHEGGLLVESCQRPQAASAVSAAVWRVALSPNHGRAQPAGWSTIVPSHTPHFKTCDQTIIAYILLPYRARCVG